MQGKALPPPQVRVETFDRFIEHEETLDCKFHFMFLVIQSNEALCSWTALVPDVAPDAGRRTPDVTRHSELGKQVLPGQGSDMITHRLVSLYKVLPRSLSALSTRNGWEAA